MANPVCIHLGQYPVRLQKPSIMYLIFGKKQRIVQAKELTLCQTYWYTMIESLICVVIQRVYITSGSVEAKELPLCICT